MIFMHVFNLRNKSTAISKNFFFYQLSTLHGVHDVYGHRHCFLMLVGGIDDQGKPFIPPILLADIS